MKQARDAIINQFLAEAGWGLANRTKITGDVSPRRYIRLSGEGGQAVLMDADPKSCAPVHSFASIADFLTRAGYSAPEIYARDLDAGLLLLEDFGDNLLAQHLMHQPEDEASLYALAVALLAQLHQTQPGTLPPYSADIYIEEVDRLWRYYLPWAGAARDTEMRSTLQDEIGSLAASLGQARAFTYLDYHAENLIYLPQRAGVKQLGLLDFQDARLGHPAYDLVSLLQDARRDVMPNLVPGLIRSYLDQTGLEEADFLRAYHFLGVQRNLKILGIFARMALEGRPHYQPLMLRVWAHLQAGLQASGLENIARWVGRYVPPPQEKIAS